MWEFLICLPDDRDTETATETETKSPHRRHRRRQVEADKPKRNETGPMQHNKIFYLMFSLFRSVNKIICYKVAPQSCHSLGFACDRVNDQRLVWVSSASSLASSASRVCFG